ncbi:hypothetical protein [Corynebacterium tapiri]|uniref:DUF4190 domain-containing protein n=1 Tax=Corynebacterium tapiri TaxID=1448266 RepID=A0A5C4U4K9_9CORY|nr:hypothetical protein [Corynebacterium tapiri]TNL99200.1 hypothetical protein FHE74_02260 [Corynebacterium tapiri]
MSTPNNGGLNPFDGNKDFGASNSEPAAANPVSSYPGAGTPAPQGEPGYAGYTTPDYGTPQFTGDVPVRKNGLALAALILGLVGFVLMLLFIGLIGISPLLGLIGLILGIVALVKAKNYTEGYKRKGMAITGIVFSVLTLVASALLYALFGAVLSIPGIMDCMSLQDSAAIEQCVTNTMENQTT